MGASQSTASKPEQRQSTEFSEKSVAELVDAVEYMHVGGRSGLKATPESADGTISKANTTKWERKVAGEPKLQLSRTILQHTDFKSALTIRDARVADQHVFNLELDFKTGPITSQNSSGRCWLFATTNVLRYEVMKKLNMDDFQLSQSYLFFWDKLNKSNYFLETMIELADRPLDDRLVNHLSEDLVSDGGQWDMAVNLVETYGAVPRAVYPESFSSSSSGALNNIVRLKLREHAVTLRKLISSLRASGSLSQDAIVATARAKKEELMSEIWTIMTTTLGVPPSADEPFTFDYYDKEGKAHTLQTTPVQFYKTYAYSKYPTADSFSLIHDPRNAYNKLYTVDKLGNIWGARPVLYVNTEIDNLKAAIVTMLKAGHPVFFGCDVGQFSDRFDGIMDTDLFAYENAFSIALDLSKAERLQLNESQMTHAMVISGVYLDAKTGKPLRYKVENSWGENVGNKGYFVMTDKWFNEFVFQVVIPKALAPKELVKVFEGGEKTVLPRWDPMGALA